MDNTIFYYLRDTVTNQPLVTICLYNENNTYYRGIAVCSPRDNPCKRVGRAIAWGRVQQAISKRIDSGFIYRDEPLRVFRQVNGGFSRKSEIDPRLTTFELKSIKNRKEK